MNGLPTPKEFAQAFRYGINNESAFNVLCGASTWPEVFRDMNYFARRGNGWPRYILAQWLSDCTDIEVKPRSRHATWMKAIRYVAIDG